MTENSKALFVTFLFNNNICIFYTTQVLNWVLETYWRMRNGSLLIWPHTVLKQLRAPGYESAKGGRSLV